MMNKKYEHFDNGVSVVQLDDMYKFTADAILLAKFCKIKHTDHVCEFCAGSGVISLYAYSLCDFEKMYFVEIQDKMCAPIRENLDISHLSNKASVLNKDIKELKNADFGKKLDIIICNPPYQKLTGAKINDSYEIAISRHEVLITLEDIIKKSSEIIKHKGKLYFMLPAERTTEAINLLTQNNFEAKNMKFVFNNKSCAYLTLIEAVYGAKSGVIISKE